MSLVGCLPVWCSCLASWLCHLHDVELEYISVSGTGHILCIWLPVFAGACIAGCNELVFDCCQLGYTHARYVFGYLRADVELGSHDT
jgi:hypothetical protein